MVWNLITKHLNPRRNLVAEQLRQLVESGRGNEVPERIPRMDRRHFNNSEHGLWHMLMGQITFRQADYEASLEHFRQGAEICPEVESFELARAQTYFFMERPAEAWACVYRFPDAELDTGWALRLCHYAYLCSDYERGLWLVGILVERYREVVAGGQVLPQQHDIAEDFGRGALRACQLIRPFQHTGKRDGGGDVKPPRRAIGIDVPAPAGPGIDRPVGPRRRCRLGNFGAGAAAGVEQAHRLEPLAGCGVAFQARRLERDLTVPV